MSQITTHILDTSTGKPAEGVLCMLQRPEGDSWQTIGQGETNSDGRVPDLLSEGELLDPGTYRMYFDTDAYFSGQSIKGFYPYVTIVFETFDQSHYHVPLLLNPFGYSTYRGS